VCYLGTCTESPDACASSKRESVIGEVKLEVVLITMVLASVY
jgi:hypothetical protein